jgi:hypothetical protein
MWRMPRTSKQSRGEWLSDIESTDRHIAVRPDTESLAVGQSQHLGTLLKTIFLSPSGCLAVAAGSRYLGAGDSLESLTGCFRWSDGDSSEFGRFSVGP